WCAPTELRADPLRYAHFFSDYLHAEYARHNIFVEKPTVVHHGVDLHMFQRRPHNDVLTKRLLYSGRLSPEKGVDTAIRALATLRDRYAWSDLRLDLAGRGEKDYVDSLKSLIQELALADRVSFMGLVRRADIPALYGQYDVLLFTSTWAEPFSITVV